MAQEKVQVIPHKGKEIIFIDISQITSEDIYPILEEAARLIRSGEQKSKLIMTDVTQAKYSKETSELMKDFTSKNTPYVKASAVVGAEGVQLILLQTLVFITRRELKTFNSREEAMDWLISVE